MAFKTRRKGVLMIASATLLFIVSGLFLANTVVNPVESLAYLVGEVLCFIVTPILLISGIVVCIIAPHEKKEKRTTMQAPTPLACSYCGRNLSTFPRDITVCPYCGKSLPQRTCPSCGGDLSQFPTDIKKCPYCGKAVSIQVEAIPVKVRTRRILGVALLAILFLPLMFGGPPILPLYYSSGIVAGAYLLASKRHRRKIEFPILMFALLYGLLPLPFTMPLWLWLGDLPNIFQTLSPGFIAQWGFGTTILFFTAPIESVLAISGGILLVLKKI